MREEPESLTQMRYIMRNEIEKVLEAMREDYRRWSDRCAKHDSYAH